MITKDKHSKLHHNVVLEHAVLLWNREQTKHHPNLYEGCYLKKEVELNLFPPQVSFDQCFATATETKLGYPGKLEELDQGRGKNESMKNNVCFPSL